MLSWCSVRGRVAEFASDGAGGAEKKTAILSDEPVQVHIYILVVSARALARPAVMLYGSVAAARSPPRDPSTHHHAVCRPQRTRMRCGRSSR